MTDEEVKQLIKDVREVQQAVREVEQAQSYAELLEVAIKQFRKLQDNECGPFGAGDTEPDAEFEACVVAAFLDGTANIPTTADGWDIYDGKPGAEEAAIKMHDATATIVKIISDAPMRERQAIRAVIERNLWRMTHRLV